MRASAAHRYQMAILYINRFSLQVLRVWLAPLFHWDDSLFAIRIYRRLTRNGSKTLTSSFLPKLVILILETYKHKNHHFFPITSINLSIFLFFYKCTIYPGQKGKYAWVHVKSVYVYLSMTCLVAPRTRRVCTFSYITTSDFILELNHSQPFY